MEVQELLLFILLTVKLLSSSAFFKKNLLNSAVFADKWRQEQVCEAAGKELFGHFKVGKHSLGSNASWLDGLKEIRYLFVCPHLCRL